MPPELDKSRVETLIRLLEKHPSTVVFTERAHRGHRLGAEPDDLGLDRVMPAKFTPKEKERRMVMALLDFLKNGGRPNRLDESYGTVYEFRFDYKSLCLYVKTQFPPADAANPVLMVTSIKKQN